MRMLLLFLAACAVSPPTSSTDSAVTASGSAWVRHQLVAPTLTGQLRGADDNDIATVGGKLSIGCAFEDGGGITIAAADGSTTSPVVITGMPSSEDVELGDVDRDGNADAIVTRTSSKEVEIGFGPGFTTIIELVAAHDVQQWWNSALTDVDSDGDPDIVTGGQGPAGTLGYFAYGTNPRSASDWSYSQIGCVGWLLTMKATPWGVFYTDRKGSTCSAYSNPKKGAWLATRSGGVWTVTHLAHVTGDPSYGDAVDIDGDTDMDFVVGNFTSIKLYEQANGTFTAGANLYPSNAGNHHGSTLCDIDGAGDLDVVSSFAVAAAGKTWLAYADDTGAWFEIGGTDAYDHKPDFAECADLDGDGDIDVAYSDGGEDNAWQDDIDRQGGSGWFENPRL